MLSDARREEAYPVLWEWASRRRNPRPSAMRAVFMALRILAERYGADWHARFLTARSRGTPSLAAPTRARAADRPPSPAGGRPARPGCATSPAPRDNREGRPRARRGDAEVRAEPIGGVFQVREDELSPRVEAGCTNYHLMLNRAGGRPRDGGGAGAGRSRRLAGVNAALERPRFSSADIFLTRRRIGSNPAWRSSSGRAKPQWGAAPRMIPRPGAAPSPGGRLTLPAGAAGRSRQTPGRRGGSRG